MKLQLVWGEVNKQPGLQNFKEKFFVKIKSICKEATTALVQVFYRLNLLSIVLNDEGRAVNIVY